MKTAEYKRHRNHEKRRRRQREHMVQIYAFKESRPCADCRQFFPHYVMDCDHVSGEKLFDVGTRSRSIISKAQLKRVLAEMAKCDLVCANCHRKRTHARQVARIQRGESDDGGTRLALV